MRLGKRIASSFLGVDDDSTMDCGSGPITMSMPP